VTSNEKLGAAAEYLATQVASKKADAIVPALGPATAGWPGRCGRLSDRWSARWP
jgi:hypothetical protein